MIRPCKQQDINDTYVNYFDHIDMYPEQTHAILLNIAWMLLNDSFFYFQVLRLMEKLQLPMPFGPHLPYIELQRVSYLKRKRFEESEDDDSDYEEPPKKKQKVETKEAIRLIDMIEKEEKKYIEQKEDAPKMTFQFTTSHYGPEPHVKITDEQLKEGKISSIESVSGVPNCKVYVKRLPRKNTELSELEFLFGKYFDNREEMRAYVCVLFMV